jgi:serine/threonine-protein kinase
LREAHAIDLIHRDIKPSNILACRRGGLADVVKLLDFGLVRHIDRAVHEAGSGVAAASFSLGLTIETGQGGITGTPEYVSPEQITHPEQIGHRSDIYGVGALAYYLLTASPPFVRRNIPAVLAAHVHEEVEPPSRWNPAIPADLEQIILNCLGKDPEGRPPNVEALEAALARCQCSGDWTAEMANEWWEQNFAPEPPDADLPPAPMAGGTADRGPAS